MLKLFPEMQEDFPEAPRIISFRNYLIHGYASVSNEVVWGILQKDLTALADRVAELLARGEVLGRAGREFSPRVSCLRASGANSGPLSLSARMCGPMDTISVRGAREHNLKNVTLEIPRNRLV